MAEPFFFFFFEEHSCRIPWSETRDNIKSNESASLQEGRGGRAQLPGVTAQPGVPDGRSNRARHLALVSEGGHQCQTAFPLYLIFGVSCNSFWQFRKDRLDTTVHLLDKVFGQTIAKLLSRSTPDSLI